MEKIENIGCYLIYELFYLIRYPLPNLQIIQAKIKGKQWLAKLDFCKGYFQVDISEESYLKFFLLKKSKKFLLFHWIVFYFKSINFNPYIFESNISKMIYIIILKECNPSLNKRIILLSTNI